MRIVEVTYRNRNDFHFVAHCPHCSKKSRHGDGYADHYYQTQVFPARHCKHCGLNEYGDIAATAPKPQTEGAS